MGTQHIIEFNGKRYDTLTGKIVNDSSAQINPTKPPRRSSSKPKNLDGFATAKHSIVHQVQPAVAHKAEKSKTLMRKTVQKPATQKLHAVATPTAELQPAQPASSPMPDKKLVSAQAIPKSKLIRRFNDDMAGITALVTKTDARESDNPARQLAGSTQPHSNIVKADPVSVALAKATSHEQPKLKKPRLHRRIAHKLHISPRVLSGSALAIAGLLLIGFFTYQNIPNLSMRVAAARSGVHGTLPGYQPAGFSMSRHISYKPGQIVLSFKSTTDNRNFKLTQAASSWDSNSLLDNYVAQNRRPSQTVQDKGKTIYIYDSSNATWVDGGIWYRVEGASNLNSDQLLNIAASM